MQLLAVDEAAFFVSPSLADFVGAAACPNLTLRSCARACACPNLTLRSCLPEPHPAASCADFPGVYRTSAWCGAAPDFWTSARPGGLGRPGPVPKRSEGRSRPSHTLGSGCGAGRRHLRAQIWPFLRVFCAPWGCSDGSMRLLAGLGRRAGRLGVCTGRPERLDGRWLLQCDAVRFQCDAVRCSPIQCGFSGMQCGFSPMQCGCSAVSVRCSAVSVGCSPFQCDAVRFSAMQCDAVRFSAMQCGFSAMQCGCSAIHANCIRDAVRFSAMQSDSVRCSAVSVGCSAMQSDSVRLQCDAVRFSAVSVGCSAVAVRCSAVSVGCSPFHRFGASIASIARFLRGDPMTTKFSTKFNAMHSSADHIARNYCI
eukprot:SAG31_NODE_1506_length_8076_cov_13.880657_6_plen_367_part_00